MPPLGLLTIATILEKVGIKVIVLPVFDYVYNEGMEVPPESLEKLRLFNPDMIGIGFMSAEWKSAKVIIESLRAAFPGAVIVAGGRHSSNFPLEVLRWGTDYVIVGEGETALTELLKALSAGRPVDNIPGLAFLGTDKKMHFYPRAEETADLDIIPAYHRIPYQKFIDTRTALVGRYLRSGWLMTSRGCFNNCIYCRDPKFGKRLRFRSMDTVMDDIRIQMKNYDLECFYLIDDMFAINEKRVIEFCDRFIDIQREFKKKLYFAAMARGDTLTERMAEAMKRAGCTQITLGAESGSQRILDFLGTRKKASDTVSAVKMLKEKQIDTFLNFIVGVPAEEEKDVFETVDLVRKLKPALVGVSFLTAYPGTLLYHLALESGWISNDDLASCSFRHSDNKSYLKFGVEQAVLDKRKQSIYRVSFNSSIANFILKKEFRYFVMDLIRIGYINPRHIFSLFSSLYRGDVDSLKETFRYMIYDNVWHHPKFIKNGNYLNNTIKDF